MIPDIKHKGNFMNYVGLKRIHKTQNSKINTLNF